MTTYEERIQAALDLAGGMQLETRTEEETSVAQAPSLASLTEDMPDLSTNEVAKIMSDMSLSDEGRAKKLVDFLACTNGDYIEAKNRFTAFKAWFAVQQSEGVEASIKAMEDLIAEVKEAQRPLIEMIVGNLGDVQKSIDVSTRLLEVIRKARLDGKTIEQIGAAFRENQALVENIENLEKDVPAREGAIERAEKRRDSAMEDDAKSRKGFFKALARTLTGPDKDLVARLKYAEELVANAKKDLEKLRDDIAAAQKKRNTSLEEGPMMILRTLDASEKSFSENLIATATHSIALLRQIAAALTPIIVRTDRGEMDAERTLKTLGNVTARDELLCGVLNKVADVTGEQTAKMAEEIAAKDGEIATTSDAVDLALKKSDRTKMVESRESALGYENGLKDMVMRFGSILSNDAILKDRANHGLRLLQTQKKLFEQLATEALPATASALQASLLEARAMQVGEQGLAIHAVTEAGQEMGGKSLGSVLKSTQEIHGAGVAHANKLIATLEEAKKTVAEQIKMTLEQGSTDRKLGARLTKLAGELGELSSTSIEVRTRMAGPAAPAAANDDAAGPGRPAKVRADEDTSPKPAVA